MSEPGLVTAAGGPARAPVRTSPRAGYAAPEVTPPPPPDFALHCSTCVRALQGSLQAMYDAVGADAARPQDVARRFKLNKNLTWKVAKVLQTAEPLEAVPLIPGADGMGLLLTAMEREGAANSVTAPVRRDFDAFDEMLRTHAGDRATLDLLIDGMPLGGKALEVSRKLAFRGNSGIWGVQARVRSMLQVLAPTAGRPDRLDDVAAAGLHELRRLRSVHGWPLFRFHHYGMAPDGVRRHREFMPIEPPASGVEPDLVMRSFCSPPEAEVRCVRGDAEVRHELAEGPIGQRGAVTFMVGSIERGVFGRYAQPGAGEAEHGEMVAFVTMPTEFAQMDVMVHRSMLGEFRPEVIVYGRPFGTFDPDPEVREQYRLPIPVEIERIDPAHESMESDLVEDRPRLIRTVVERAGWKAEDFVLFRAVVPYPPMPCSVVFRYLLPRKP